MIEVGVQTKGLIPELDIHEAIEMIKKAGFTAVDFNIDTFLKNNDVYKGNINSFFKEDAESLIHYFLQYRMELNKRGIRVSQIHAPYPIRVEGRDEQNEFMQAIVIPKSIMIAEALGAPWVVIHPFKMQYTYNKDIELSENLTYFKMLIPLLKQCKVGVCFENLYEGIGDRIVEGVCADPYDAVEYIDTLNEYAGEELFGFCLDTGHLQLTNRRPEEYIRVLGNRLKALHMHENNGYSDMHQLPYSFGNSSNQGQSWDKLISALKETGYKGVLSFETYPAMNSFPRSMRQAVLDTIYDIGVYWAGKMEE